MYPPVQPTQEHVPPVADAAGANLAGPRTADQREMPPCSTRGTEAARNLWRSPPPRTTRSRLGARRLIGKLADLLAGPRKVREMPAGLAERRELLRCVFAGQMGSLPLSHGGVWAVRRFRKPLLYPLSYGGGRWLLHCRRDMAVEVEGNR